ncbi:helix-turn-helix domain-containing protein [Enterobacter kobei]|uniref:helix-turn-helix domain-containing protein n=1 Tax=Enterobacter kobei TaxID=208224 RepID=UPI00388EC7CF
MALVSISEASRLTNKSRTTVHRYISKGKLSICTDENGVKKIDTSELLRVFVHSKLFTMNRSTM